MKILLLISFIFFHMCLQAQNLLPNASFEDHTSCPTMAGQVDSVTHWFQVTESPDYFNSCSPISSLSVPNNLFGYQLPVYGDAYCGMWCYNPSPNSREYIGTELDNPLVIGQQYFVSFNINLAGAPLVVYWE
ncbi:MAG: hypothetical protein ABIQ74_00910 [Chitinophagales bacterium]